MRWVARIIAKRTMNAMLNVGKKNIDLVSSDETATLISFWKKFVVPTHHSILL
jgi:hypothetical protein